MTRRTSDGNVRNSVNCSPCARHSLTIAGHCSPQAGGEDLQRGHGGCPVGSGADEPEVLGHWHPVPLGGIPQPQARFGHPAGLQPRQHGEPDRASPPPALRRRRLPSVTARCVSGTRGAISTPARSGVRKVRSGPGLTRPDFAHWRSARRRRGGAKLIAVLGDRASRDGQSVCARCASSASPSGRSPGNGRPHTTSTPSPNMASVTSGSRRPPRDPETDNPVDAARRDPSAIVGRLIAGTQPSPPPPRPRH